MNFDILGTYLVYSVIGTPVVGTACCLVVMLAEFVDGTMTPRREAKLRAAEPAPAPTAPVADFQSSALSAPSPVELRVKRARRELCSAAAEPLNLAA